MSRSPKSRDMQPPKGAAALRRSPGQPGQKGLDEKLDDALKNTFPASDPFLLAPDGDPNSAPSYASPPCFMHELDPSYLGYLSRTEVLAFLNTLLEGERAGARGAGKMSQTASDTGVGATLRRIAHDEARFCAMLALHVQRLGGTASASTGAFYDKLLALEDQNDRLELLNRGQGWVVRTIREALPRISDQRLKDDLGEMVKVHERNIELCQ